MNYLKIKVLCLTLLFLGFTFVYGQLPNFSYSNDILVKEADTIPLAWVGGMNHPQFSTIDINYDGNLELVAFEPDNGQISVFKMEKIDGKMVYSYLKDTEGFFPSGMKNRLQIFDYNHDGKKDLFTYGVPSGIKVYKNIGNAIEGLQWMIVADPIISTSITNQPSTIYASHSTIPALVDVDNDGDMDILTFSSSRKIVEWHKNVGIEDFGNPDTLVFQLEQPCWGDFEETTGNAILLHSTIPPCNTNIPTTPSLDVTMNGTSDEVKGTVRHQGGGAILALDINGDGLKDVLIGDHEFNNLTLVVNGGTDPNLNANMVSTDDNFPSYDVSVDLSNFLTAYYEDVNLDGVKDLIVSTTNINNSDNADGVWLYINTGANDNPHFEFKTAHFLQGAMIENGQSSIPIMVDVDNNGLQDLLVANDYVYLDSIKKTQINYYKNIGSNSQPVFQLNNKDWNGFSTSGLSLRVCPSFGDLDGDGDQDMVVGIADGRLFYYENAGGNNAMLFNIAQYQLLDSQNNPIIVASNATPELFDINQDGLIDLVVAGSNAPLKFYKNIGSTSNFSFELVNSNLGQINPIYQAACVPRFFKNNGQVYLLAGSAKGTLQLYDNIQQSIGVGASFHLAESNFAGINMLKFSAPEIGKIKNDDTYNLWVGSILGGVVNYASDSTFLSNYSLEDYKIPSTFKLYPNPNNGTCSVDVSDIYLSNYTIRVLDLLGKTVFEQQNVTEPVFTFQIKQKDNSGLYFVHVFSSDKSRVFIKKMAVK